MKCRDSLDVMRISLVGIRKSPHPTHDPQNVVVRRIHTHLGAGGRAYRIVGHRD